MGCGVSEPLQLPPTHGCHHYPSRYSYILGGYGNFHPTRCRIRRHLSLPVQIDVRPQSHFVEEVIILKHTYCTKLTILM